MADKSSKLSLLARFDDMSRFQNSISLNDKLFVELKKALDYCEKMRTKCLNMEKELKECRSKITELEKTKVEMDKEFSKLQLDYNNIYDENKKVKKELSDLKSTISEFNSKTRNYNNADQTQLLTRLNRLRKTSDSDSGCIASPPSGKKVISTVTPEQFLYDSADSIGLEISECIVESPDEVTSSSSLIKHNFERKLIFSANKIKCLGCFDYIELYSPYNFCEKCKSTFHDNCINENYCHESKDFYLKLFKLSNLNSKQCSILQLLINSFADIEKRALDVEQIYIVKCCLENIEMSFWNLLDGDEYSELEVHTLCNIVLYLFEILLELKMPIIAEDSLNYFLSNLTVITKHEVAVMFYNLENKAQQYMFIRLMLHLQRVLKNNEKNHVSKNMLAQVWASKLFDAKELAMKKEIPLKALKHMQFDLMMKLLNISTEFWNKLLLKISSDEQLCLIPLTLPPPPPPPPPPPKLFQNNTITPLIQRKLKPNLADFQSPLSYQTAISSLYNTPIGNRTMAEK